MLLGVERKTKFVLCIFVQRVSCQFLRLGSSRSRSRHILFLCLTCGLCNILLIPVTLNLVNTHSHTNTHTNTRQVLQIRTEHEPNWEHENQPKIPAVGVEERQTLERDAEQQPYVDDNMQRHVCTHTHTNKHKCKCKYMHMHTLPQASLLQKHAISLSHRFFGSNMYLHECECVCVCSQFNFMTDWAHAILFSKDTNTHT